MAKPNYSFQKRQKELERKKKNEEKLQRKLNKQPGETDEDTGPAADDVDVRHTEP
jgi:hypothetical protein